MKPAKRKSSSRGHPGQRRGSRGEGVPAGSPPISSPRRGIGSHAALVSVCPGARRPVTCQCMPAVLAIRRSACDTCEVSLGRYRDRRYAKHGKGDWKAARPSCGQAVGGFGRSSRRRQSSPAGSPAATRIAGGAARGGRGLKRRATTSANGPCGGRFAAAFGVRQASPCSGEVPTRAAQIRRRWAFERSSISAAQLSISPSPGDRGHCGAPSRGVLMGSGKTRRLPCTSAAQRATARPQPGDFISRIGTLGESPVPWRNRGAATPGRAHRQPRAC